MIKILRTDSENPDFIKLTRLLDEYLAEKDGNDHSGYQLIPNYGQYAEIENSVCFEKDMIHIF